jgi:hypothetical protein
MAMRGHSLRIFAALGFSVLATIGCQNDVPTFVSYKRDIAPMMQAHCTRCHGAGGMLNTDPEIAPINNSTKPLATDFTTEAGLMPYTGAGALGLATFIQKLPMPPPPAPPLTPWEYDTLMTWLANPLP